MAAALYFGFGQIGQGIGRIGQGIGQLGDGLKIGLANFACGLDAEGSKGGGLK